MSKESSLYNRQLSILYRDILSTDIHSSEVLYNSYSYLVIYINSHYGRAYLRYYPNTTLFRGGYKFGYGDIDVHSVNVISPFILAYRYNRRMLNKNTGIYLYPETHSYNIILYFKKGSYSSSRRLDSKDRISVYMNSNNIFNVMCNHMNNYIKVICKYE